MWIPWPDHQQIWILFLADSLWWLQISPQPAKGHRSERPFLNTKIRNTYLCKLLSHLRFSVTSLSNIFSPFSYKQSNIQRTNLSYCLTLTCTTASVWLHLFKMAFVLQAPPVCSGWKTYTGWEEPIVILMVLQTPHSASLWSGNDPRGAIKISMQVFCCAEYCFLKLR